MAFPIKPRGPVVSVRGRIKPGTLVLQDFAVSAFPRMPRDEHPIDPDTVFNIEPDPHDRGCLVAWKDGYGGGVRGRPGSYGSGQLFLAAAAPPEGKEK